MTTTQDLSLKQARKLVLLSQGLHKNTELGRGRNATLKAIEKLGYIQIDTISVVERAHHHTLWTRADGYQAKHLDQLVEQRKVFEYWSHAAAYLPMRDYRFSLPRKQAIAAGEKHWHVKNEKVAKQVLQRVQQEGPLQARDFEHTRRGDGGWWEWKPAKLALEQLFMEGELMIVRRQGFQKVYDLTERVLTDEIDSRTPSSEEYHGHLIEKYLRSNGVGTPSQIAYLLKGIKASIREHCQQMLEDQQLEQVVINKQDYFALPGFEQLLDKPLSRKKVKILSPFDNLLIQRKRTCELFGFDYQIECYVPAAKRKFGYFVLPILWGHEFAGRMDAKIDRKTGVLTVSNLYVETHREDEFIHAFKSALQEFLLFNGGTQLQIESTSGLSNPLTL